MSNADNNQRSAKVQWAANRINRLRSQIRHGFAGALRRSRSLTKRAADAPLRVRVATGAAVLLTLVTIGLLIWTPSVNHLGPESFNRSTIVYTADGEVVTRYFDDNRTWIELDDVSPAVIEAVIATEDRRFYMHSGVDLIRTVGAVFNTFSGETQGGSTITMQLARNAFPEMNQNVMLVRKVKEWFTAFRIEMTHPKDEILEMYLNVVPFIFRAHGIEAAALTYFDKHAAELDVLEAATLVGMLKGPSYYNPVLHPERSRERRNVVLASLVAVGRLSQDRFEELREAPTPIAFRPTTLESSIASHFSEYVRLQLDTWADENGYNLYTGGLRVHTTLDAGLQRSARTAYDRTLQELQDVVDVSWSAPSVPYFSQRLEAYAGFRERVRAFEYYWDAHPDVLDRIIRQSDRGVNMIEGGAPYDETVARLRENAPFVDSLKAAASVLQGGFVAIDPNNGHVRAWVGGRDISKTQFDHVAQARRQPGSTFKPFVYATALANGYMPDDALPDWPFRYVNRATRQSWAPGNFGGASGSLLSLRHALAYSKNTISAQLVMRLGARRVADIAQRMGIRTELDAVPSIALGSSPVSLLELTAAYGTIANLGTYREPLTITRIETQDGELIESFESPSRQAIPAAVAYGVLDMMRGVVDRGTGTRIRSQYGARGELAGKTGTTQRAADTWFMLMHPDLITGSWIGFDVPEITFRTSWWGQGAHSALHIAGRFHDLIDLPDRAFQRPPGLGGGTTLAMLLRESRGGEDGDDQIPPSTETDWAVTGFGGEGWNGPEPGTPGFSATAWLNYRQRATSPVRGYLEQLRRASAE